MDRAAQAHAALVWRAAGARMAVDRFYWLIPDVLAGCSRPGGAAGHVDLLDEHLDWLRAQGIGAMLSLTETPLVAEALARCGMDVLHLPVADLTAPSATQLLEALGFIDWQRALGRAVVVHCLMGQGRTGTVLAAHLIRGGMPPDAAVRELRAICPGALSSPVQERALEAFAARRDWIL